MSKNQITPEMESILEGLIKEPVRGKAGELAKEWGMPRTTLVSWMNRRKHGMKKKGKSSNRKNAAKKAAITRKYNKAKTPKTPKNLKRNVPFQSVGVDGNTVRIPIKSIKIEQINGVFEAVMSF